ncbi:hypothetical protein E2C01_037966 [Portunus trituberculatus]|uniref:Uncharacterized protein n=1 Tax=Portunus trituberculatus TaxID=210409 RepID=A0A5B7FFH8_PORTR|nr:hypothetical protein [Portunus trituberculatus]
MEGRPRRRRRVHCEGVWKLGAGMEWKKGADRLRHVKRPCARVHLPHAPLQMTPAAASNPTFLLSGSAHHESVMPICGPEGGAGFVGVVGRGHEPTTNARSPHR